MIPRIHPLLGWAEVGAALHWPGADDVARYERAFAASMGQRHAIAFSYGRSALSIALRALLGGGREVICPAYTCVVVAHAIVQSGNIPIFVDPYFLIIVINSRDQLPSISQFLERY